jgi:hypothetical protein
LFWYFFFSSVSAIWYLRSVSTKKKWSDILSSASAKSGILTVLQLLQFSISVCLCNCFGISSSLQFLQFGICVQFLPKKKEWSDILSSASAKSGISTSLQFLLPLLQNLIF